MSLRYIVIAKLKKARRVYMDEGFKIMMSRALRYISRIIQNKKQSVSESLFLNSEVDFESISKIKEDNQMNAAFTIVSKNYMHYALALRESFLNYNENFRFVIVLMDMYDDEKEMEVFYELSKLGVEVLNFNSLRLSINASKELDEMLSKYSILEMNTAVKPYVIESLLKEGHQKVFYIDPDILFYSNSKVIEDGLETNNFVLTPHITSPYYDDKNPSEIDIMRGGVYNLGFIGVKNSPEVFKMLTWWQTRLLKWCYSDPDKGLFTDQKWIDLLPSLYEGVRIEKNPGLNVAYWNLHERKILRHEKKWYINGNELVFFHFSGLPLSGSGSLSKHQNRFSIDSIENLSPLVKDYREKVNRFAPGKFSKYRYYFSTYGATKNLCIPDVLRSEFMSELHQDIKNPYLGCNLTKNRISKYLTKDMFGDSNISRIGLGIWEKREDLKSAFGDILSSQKSRVAFKNWFECSAEREYKIPNELMRIEPILDDNDSVGFGINVIGYFENVIGVAEAARLFYQKGLSVGVPMSLFSIGSDAHGKLSDDEFNLYRSSLAEWPSFEKSIFYVNANEISNVKNYFPHLFEDKDISAVWWWEFEDYFNFPEAFDCVDRVITYTDFVAGAVRKSCPSNVEVLKQTYPFMQNWEIKVSKKKAREQFGLLDEYPVFIYVFDLHSGFERKNPLALIKAFSIFKEKYKCGHLILKIGHPESHFENYNLLIDSINKLNLQSSITIIDKPLSRSDLMTMVNMADAYVSSHRSEGLGLGMLEAMWMGIPVIATAYGGNLEFMNNENSFLVDYSLTEIKNDFGPYKKGWRWAEPKVEALAEKMSLLIDSSKEVEDISLEGMRSAQAQYCQDIYNKELMELLQ